MKIKFLLLVITIIFLLLVSCDEDQGPLIDSYNIFFTQENSLNHLNLAIDASYSKLVHNETLNFTSDTIIVSLKIVGLEGDGTGDVHLYQDQSTTVSAYYFNRDTLMVDTLLTDTLISKPPDKATITFKRFTGNLEFQMDGK
jgi:hypothetical protein